MLLYKIPWQLGELLVFATCMFLYLGAFVLYLISSFRAKQLHFITCIYLDEVTILKLVSSLSKLFFFGIRYQLNRIKNKVDDYPGKGPTQHSTQELAIWLSDPFNGEDFTDRRKPLSKSLIGGTINTCKNRTISFMRNERVHQGLPCLNILSLTEHDSEYIMC